VHEPQGRPPAGFEPVPPTLEDAYLLLMGTAAIPVPAGGPGAIVEAGPNGAAPEPAATGTRA
jgi:hypothetical protein